MDSLNHSKTSKDQTFSCKKTLFLNLLSMAEIGLTTDQELIQKIIAKHTSKNNPEEVYYRKALEIIRLASRMRKEGRPLDTLSTLSRVTRASNRSVNFHAKTGHQTV